MDKRAIVLLLFFCLLSCKLKTSNNIEREKLFSLSLGRQEDQIAIYSLDNKLSYSNNNIFMRDNMIYITDNNSLKLMKFTPFGDLIFLLYNKIFNINPLLVSNGLIDKTSTRKALEFDFSDIRNMAQDSYGTMIVQDRLSKNPKSSKNSTILRRFLKDGKYLDFLGQDGIGTKAFFNINNIYVKNNDDLFLSTSDDDGYNVYSYSHIGSLLYKKHIQVSDIPILKEYEGTEVFVSLINIYPDMEQNSFYVYVSYYKKLFDKDGKTEGIKTLPNYIYKYNQKTEKFEDVFTLDYHDIKDKKILYTFLGIDQKDNMFFISQKEARISLLILNSKGENVLKENLFLNRQEPSIYNKIKVSKKGIIYGLFGYNDRFDIYWWRIDKLLN